MADFIHRNSDSRSCGASTNTRIPNVRVNGRFISVDGDTNSHGAGGLKSSITKVRAGGINVVVQGDSANPDKLCPIPGGPHCNPKANSASNDTRAGNGA